MHTRINSSPDNRRQLQIYWKQLDESQESCTASNHPGKVTRIGRSPEEMGVKLFRKANNDRREDCSNDAKRQCTDRASHARKEAEHFFF